MPAAHKLALGTQNAVFTPIYNRALDRLESSFATLSGDPLAFSPSGAWIATSISGAPRIRLLNADTLAAESGLPTLTHNPTSMSWSPDSARLAMSLAGGVGFAVLNVATKALVAGVRDYTSWIPTSVAYSPDGTKVAVSGAGFGVLEILNASDWSLLQSLTNRSAGIGNAVAWSPDGSMVVQCHAGAPGMTVWETTGWTQVAAAPTLPATSGQRCSWSPDGGYIAFRLSAAPRFCVVRVSDWTIVSGTFAPGVAVQDVAYSPSGELAIAYDATPYAQILNTAGTSIVWTPSPLVVAPQRCAWSPAGALGAVSGTVVDENAAPVVRDLLLMHDATEAIVGSTTSAADGSYSISTPYSDGHTVLLLEDTGRVQAVGGGIIPL